MVTIQETIRSAINIRGCSILKNTHKLLFVIEDLAPHLSEERDFIKKIYNDNLGEILEDAYNAALLDRITYLRKANKFMKVDNGRNGNWRRTIFSYFEFLFPNKEAIDNLVQNSFDMMEEKEIIFDAKRFLSEVNDREFIIGKKAYDAEDFSEARIHLNKAYVEGNALAGVVIGTMYYTGTGYEKDYNKALSFFIYGMQNGCPLGAEWLSYSYKYGRGVPEDFDKGKRLFMRCEEALESMCMSGSADAQYAYGFALLYGNFKEKNEKKALYWLKKAMDAGNINAGVQVAKIYLNGWGVDRDVSNGLQIILKYTNSHNKTAQFEIGKLYFYGKIVKKDIKKAFEFFLNAARKGHSRAQDYVGDYYFYGLGIEKDRTEAKKWYELAENQGNSHSSLQLGNIYYYGMNVVADDDKAFKYYKYAADKDNEEAQYMLSMFYFFNDKYKNYDFGKEYLEKSAKQGLVEAQKLLARCYIGSFEFKEDDEKFVFWITKAAEQDDAEAQRILGEAYIDLENDAVLEKSYSKAIIWLDRAAENGDIKAIVKLAEIHALVDDFRDDGKANLYINKADCLLSNADASDNDYTTLCRDMADLCYKFKDTRDFQQKAYDYYCKAYLEGDKESLYDVGWMCLVNGYKSNLFDITSDELVKLIVSKESDYSTSGLSYLLGVVYYNGYKVRQDKDEAEKWYLEAIKKGSLSAACKLAYYYINEGQRYGDAVMILENAQKRGSVEAARLLGLCYKKGIGVKKNRNIAKKFLKLAADNGDEEAKAEMSKFLF